MKQQIRWKKDTFGFFSCCPNLFLVFLQNLLKSDFETEPILLFLSSRLHHARFMWTKLFLCAMRTTWATETFYCSHDDIAAVEEEGNFADFKMRKILLWILMNFEMQTRWRNPKQRDMKKKATKFDAINFIACTRRNMKKYLQNCKFFFSMLLNLERVRMCISAGLQDSYWVSNILTRFMILFTYFYDILQNVANMHFI